MAFWCSGSRGSLLGDQSDAAICGRLFVRVNITNPCSSFHYAESVVWVSQDFFLIFGFRSFSIFWFYINGILEFYISRENVLDYFIK